MAKPDTEWRVDIYKDTGGQVYACLYGFDEDGQGDMIADEAFGPFDTAKDLTDWVLRHWGPRVRLPLR